MSKIQLPKDVCEALDKLQSNTNGGHNLSKYGIIAYVNDGVVRAEYPELRIVHEYFFRGVALPDELVTALANGYEVELSPEERVASIFAVYNDKYEDYDNGVRLGIIEVLEIYGIKIEGVNA